MSLFRIAVLALGLAALTTPAQAGHCPVDITAIDTALAANPPLSTDMLMVVQTLRDRGAELHPSNHGASIAYLHTAMELLGIGH